MNFVWKYLAALPVLLGSTVALSEVPVSTSEEIGHLLSSLSSSGCKFYRNGTWHDSEAARAHLEKKYKVSPQEGHGEDCRGLHPLGGHSEQYQS